MLKPFIFFTEYSIREQGNVEDYIIVWLHGSNAEEEQCQAKIAQLRRIVNCVKAFEKIDDCIAFLNKIKNERVFFIMTAPLNDVVDDRITELKCLQATYILDAKSDNQQSCPDNRASSINVHTDLPTIIQKIDAAINRSTSSSCVSISGSVCMATQEPSRFVYAHCIRAVILDLAEHDVLAKEKMIDFCRLEYFGNEVQLQLVDEFERDYNSSNAVWWFTRPCFISKMLSKALRVPEPDMLFKMRPFIQEVHQQLKSAEQKGMSTLYRAEETSADFIDKLKSDQGNLIIFPGFVSATSDKQSAWAKVNDSNTSSARVLFKMEIDSANHILADIDTLSYVPAQFEVIISFGSVFRIMAIEEIEYNVHCIHLSHVVRSDQDFEKLVEPMKKKIKAPAPLIRLGKLMCKVADRTRLDHLLKMLDEDGSLNHHKDLVASLAAVYQLIGDIDWKKGDIERALLNKQKSLAALRRVLPENHPGLSPAYNNIGSMLFQLGREEEALDYHQKALNTQLESPSSDPSAITAYLHNLGTIYLRQGKTAETLRCFSRALQIKLQMCSPNDPDLASAYDSLGDVHTMREEYSQAVSNYEKALAIESSSPKYNPQALASYARGLGNAYHQLNLPERSLHYFQQALTYSLEYSPSGENLASLYNNIGSQLFRLKRGNEAIPYYMQSLEIRKSVLPDDSPEIADLYMNLATNYSSMGQFDDAIAVAESAIEQLLKTMSREEEPVQEKLRFIEQTRQKVWLTSICTS